MRRSLVIAALTLSFASGCQLFGGARIQEIATAAGKPSNVATMVAVTDSGKPIEKLPVSSFKLYEGGQLVDTESSKLELLDPGQVATFHTVVLLDLTQNTGEEDRKQLAKAAGALIQRLRQSQPVTLFGFDGGADLRWLGDFSVDPHAEGPEAIDAINLVTPRDTSRNLRGAVVKGLESLRERLHRGNKPVQLGTLLVFSRGPDLAGRVGDELVTKALEDTKYVTRFFIGVSGAPGDATTRALAQAGQELAQSADTLPIAFENAAAIVNTLKGQYYLLSYCSPSRAGQRKLRVEVTVPSSDGRDQTTSFDTTFDSTGFGPNCSPKNLPHFTLVQAPTGEGTATSGVSVNGTSSKATTPSSSTPTNHSTGSSSKPHEPQGEVPPPDRPGYTH